MSIKLECPRCKCPLSVPQKKAGSYASCPRCQGRFWVPKDAPGDSSQVETVTLRAPAARLATPPALPTTPPAVPAAPTSVPAPAASQPPAPAPAPVPVPAPPPTALGRRVARFISADAAQSTLKLAADGKLPELRLQEGDKRAKADAKSTSVSPLVLAGVLLASVVLSIVLVFWDTESPSASTTKEQAVAREVIQSKFFGNMDRRELEPYQVLLREAQRAYHEGSRKVEQEKYRAVLDMLRAEPGARQRGLTGSHSRDKELEEQLLVLLSRR